MTVIRLFRVGKKRQPFYKIVVTDKRNAPSAGRFIEEVGFYNPITKEKSFKVERIKHWLSKGAKASDTVHNLFVSEKIIEGNKIPKHGVSKKKKEGGEKEEVKVEDKKEEVPIEKKEETGSVDEKKEPEATLSEVKEEENKERKTSKEKEPEKVEEEKEEEEKIGSQE